MHKLLLPLLLSLLLLNCKESKKSEDDSSLMPKNPPYSTVQLSIDTIPSWANPLIERYIQLTDDKMIKATRQDKDPMTWMLTGKESSDTAIYLIFQIGHSFENNRIPDGWLYIDILTRNLYEYDIVTEKLTPWKK